MNIRMVSGLNIDIINLNLMFVDFRNYSNNSTDILISLAVRKSYHIKSKV
jgi:hypothetical protein